MNGHPEIGDAEKIAQQRDRDREKAKEAREAERLRDREKAKEAREAERPSALD